jgi:hypothetical protein
MKQIRISDEIFKAIQDEAEPFVDTPDSVLIKIFSELYQSRKVGDDKVNPFVKQKDKLPFKNVLLDNLPKRRTFKAKPKGFIFDNEKYSIRNWIDLLRQVCAIMYSKHPQKIEKLLVIKGRVPHFSWNKDEVNKADQAFPVGDSGIYGNGCLNSEQVKQRTIEVLDKFGYSENSIIIIE